MNGSLIDCWPHSGLGWPTDFVCVCVCERERHPEGWGRNEMRLSISSGLGLMGSRRPLKS
jgi:hypothetical protein